MKHWCKLPTTSSNDGANALFTYKKTLSVSLHLSFFLRYLTTSSKRLVALILHTSCANDGADPTGLNRTTTLSVLKLPALASAALASRGRSARTTDADIVRGRSGDAAPLAVSLSASGIGEAVCGEGEGDEGSCDGWSDIAEVDMERLIERDYVEKRWLLDVGEWLKVKVYLSSDCMRLPGCMTQCKVSHTVLHGIGCNHPSWVPSVVPSTFIIIHIITHSNRSLIFKTSSRYITKPNLTIINHEVRCLIYTLTFV